MNVDEALEIEGTYTALPNADEVAHVLAAEVRRLRTASPYIPCECGRQIYIPAADVLHEAVRRMVDASIVQDIGVITRPDEFYAVADLVPEES
jgi:hypothetical protein